MRGRDVRLSRFSLRHVSSVGIAAFVPAALDSRVRSLVAESPIFAPGRDTRAPVECGIDATCGNWLRDLRFGVIRPLPLEFHAASIAMKRLFIGVTSANGLVNGRGDRARRADVLDVVRRQAAVTVEPVGRGAPHLLERGQNLARPPLALDRRGLEILVILLFHGCSIPRYKGSPGDELS